MSSVYRNTSSKTSPELCVRLKNSAAEKKSEPLPISMRSACLCQRHPFIFMPSLNLDLLFTSRRPSPHFIVAILLGPPVGQSTLALIARSAHHETETATLMMCFSIGKIPAASATHITLLRTGCVLKRIAYETQ